MTWTWTGRQNVPYGPGGLDVTVTGAPVHAWTHTYIHIPDLLRSTTVSLQNATEDGLTRRNRTTHERSCDGRCRNGSGRRTSASCRAPSSSHIGRTSRSEELSPTVQGRVESESRSLCRVASGCFQGPSRLYSSQDPVLWALAFGFVGGRWMRVWCSVCIVNRDCGPSCIEAVKEAKVS